MLSAVQKTPFKVQKPHSYEVLVLAIGHFQFSTIHKYDYFKVQKYFYNFSEFQNCSLQFAKIMHIKKVQFSKTNCF